MEGGEGMIDGNWVKHLAEGGRGAELNRVCD